MNASSNLMAICKIESDVLPEGVELTVRPLRTLVQSTKRKADRTQLLHDITTALAGLPVQIEADNGARDCSVVIKGPGLNADIWIGIDERPTDVPIISWFKAARDLKPVPGAWDPEHVNFAHHRKATSFPTRFSELIDMLVIGFTAARDGTAFREG